MPLEPSPKVTLTAVPPLKEVKVKVLPERLPAAAVRPAVKLVPVPVLPVRPSAESALPVPMIDRSAVVPVRDLQRAARYDRRGGLPDELSTWPYRWRSLRSVTPVARSIAVSVSAIVAPCR